MTLKLRRASPGLALALLASISIFGFVDRIIMNVLVEPIKAEFGLTDFEMGLVGGLAFAVLNVILGLVVARYAERVRRLSLITVGTLLWSLATAMTGMATNFGQLLLARIGVGVGEAVGLPSTSSVIADYFPKDRRATMLSVLHLSPPLGAFIGAAGGSLIAQHYGWQYALFAAAAPGVLLALLLHLLVEEPPRGRYDDVIDKDFVPPMASVIRRYWDWPTMRHFLIGSTIASLVGFGLNTFLAAYLSRRFGMSLLEAGLSSGLVASLPAALSVFASGWLSDRWARSNRKSYALIPAVSLALSTPIYLLAITRESAGTAITFLGIAALVQYCYLGTTFGTFHNMLHPRMRATGSAFTSMVYSLIGGGIGPVVLGGLSDVLTPRAPTPGIGLGWAMGAASLLYLWAALHYAMASRHIEADLSRPTDPETP